MKPFLKKMALLLATLCLTVGSVDDVSAQAKKKKGAAGPDPAAVAAAELEKNLEPLNKDLLELMTKIQSRALLSPDEAGKLVDIKYKLMDFMNQHPQNEVIAKSVYQAGVLFNQREAYNDAYEMFNFLAHGFPANAYGAKARGQVQQLEKRFGPNYFAVEMAAPKPVAEAPPAPEAAPAKGARK